MRQYFRYNKVMFSITHNIISSVVIAMLYNPSDLVMKKDLIFFMVVSRTMIWKRCILRAYSYSYSIFLLRSREVQFKWLSYRHLYWKPDIGSGCAHWSMTLISTFEYKYWVIASQNRNSIHRGSLFGQETWIQYQPTSLSDLNASFSIHSNGFSMKFLLYDAM